MKHISFVSILAVSLGLAFNLQAAITVLDDWHLGESDPGAANGRHATNTVDSVGGLTLTNQPGGGIYPVYTTNVSSQAAFFTGSDLGEFYSGGQYAAGKVIPNLTANFGLELWVYPTNGSGNQVIAYNGNTGSSGWGIFLAGTNCEILFGGVHLSTIPAPLALQTWTEVALVCSSGIATLYTNGLPAFSMSYTPNSPSGNFLVGADNSGLETFSGAVDEMRVFTFGGQFSPTNLLVNGPLVVTNAADSGPGSLRGAAAAANPGNSIITFAGALSGQTIFLTNGTISLNSSVTIDASALPGGIQINGNESGFYVFSLGLGVTAVLDSLTITNGSASGSGGSIDNSAQSTLTLNECALFGNTANTGSAVVNSAPCTLTLNECTLIITIPGSEDAIDNDGTLTLNACTLLGNWADGSESPIIYNFGALAITNTIISGNGGEGSTIYNTGSRINGGNNFISARTSDLAPVGNYGGPTPTMPPLPGSPVIGSGSVAANTFLTDQRGYPRTQNGLIDIGAVESADPVPGYNYAIVTTTNDFLTALTNSGVSLRSAVFYATNNATITFNHALSGQTILLSNGQIVLATNLAIDASSLPGGIQINGNGASSILGVAAGITDVLNSLTITNGNTAGNGGGIFNNYPSTLTLNECTLSGNNAYDGGGIFNEGTMTLNECTLAGNTAYADGGGIFNAPLDTLPNFPMGTLTLNECTLAGNGANSGGGVNSTGPLILNACTVSENTTGSGAGGILISGATLAMTNTIVAGNTGGDISGASPYGSSNLVTTAPELAPLGNYGGLTPTMPPMRGSPAIDAGADFETNFFTTDQRGYPRRSGARVDIGAVEVRIAGANFPLTGLTRLGNGSFQFSLTNLVGGSFTVFATTNLTQPFNTWSNLGPVTESPVGSGLFQFTDSQATNYPYRFYRVTSP